MFKSNPSDLLKLMVDFEHQREGKLRSHRLTGQWDLNIIWGAALGGNPSLEPLAHLIEALLLCSHSALQHTTYHAAFQLPVFTSVPHPRPRTAQVLIITVSQPGTQYVANKGCLINILN